MDQLINRCIDRWINLLIDLLIDQWIEGWIDGWIDVIMDVSMDQWIDLWINQWIDGGIKYTQETIDHRRAWREQSYEALWVDLRNSSIARSPAIHDYPLPHLPHLL